MVDSQPGTLRPVGAGTPQLGKHNGPAGSRVGDHGRVTFHASTRENPKSTRGI